jgi:hypothetical protein
MLLFPRKIPAIAGQKRALHHGADELGGNQLIAHERERQDGRSAEFGRLRQRNRQRAIAG